MTTRLQMDTDWVYFRTLLPQDLDGSAARSGVLRRRRGVRDAESLLRILLAYGCTDLSLKSVAAWAHEAGLCDCSAPALFYRVRDSDRWLAELLTDLLAPQIRPVPVGYRLRVVDATVLCGPGASGTQWRVHVLGDPRTGELCHVELADEHVGESYALHPVQRGDVVLGDRGYATARGLHALAQRDAYALVRLNPHAIRLCDNSRRLLDLLKHQEQVPQVGVISWEIVVPVPPERRSKSHKSWSLDKAQAWLPARVLAARTRKGGVIWILTTIPKDKTADAEAMDLYRLRWQVELQFKRLKSLLELDQLPTGTGPTARSWILARLLAAALVEQLSAPNSAISPWGYRLRCAHTATTKPVARVPSGFMGSPQRSARSSRDARMRTRSCPS